MRKLLALVLALMMVFTLGIPAMADGEETLTWALWDLESTAYWQALADGYEASHDGVKIEIVDLGSTDI